MIDAGPRGPRRHRFVEAVDEAVGESLADPAWDRRLGKSDHFSAPRVYFFKTF